MWTLAYRTKNLRAPQNPLTQGQCGGECAVWIANMYDRRSKPALVDTSPEGPNTLVSIETHLAGLRVAPRSFVLGKPDLGQLPAPQANMRMVAAAGMKPEHPAAANWQTLAQWLADERSAFGYGGHFIDIGGHAIATFVTSKKAGARATYEKKRTLYFFDPFDGCYHSDDENDFHQKFARIDAFYRPQLKDYQQDWCYIKVRAVKDHTDAYDTDVSSLFGG
jgi:hypothetical protein